MVRLKKNSVFYSTLLFAAEGVALQVMGFVYRIALSRLIGAEGMGVYGIVMPFYSVINSFAISGLALAVTKESAKNKGDVRRYIKAGKNLFFMLFLLCAGTVVLFRGAIAEKLLGDVRTAPALLMLLPCLFLTGIENIYKAYFQGSKNIVPALVSELAEQAVRIAAVVVILSAVPQKGAQTSVMLIVAGMIISELFSSVFLSAIFRFLAPAPPLSPESGTAVGTAVFKAAMPVSLAALLNNIIAGANAVVLPRRLIGAGMEKAEALSEFGILTGMTIPFLMMPAALIFPITSVMVPRLARAVFENRGDTVKRKCAKAFHVTGIISGGAACLMLTLGGDIAPALYGEPEAGRFIAPLTLAAVLTFFQIVSGSILNGIGRQKLCSASITVACIIHLAVTWALAGVPEIGVGGYVIGDIVSALFGALFNIFFTVRYTGLSLRVFNWVIKPALSAMFAMGVMFIICPYIFSAFKSHNISVAVGAVLCLAAYFSALHFQGVSLARYIKTICEFSPAPTLKKKPITTTLSREDSKNKPPKQSTVSFA